MSTTTNLPTIADLQRVSAAGLMLLARKCQDEAFALVPVMPRGDPRMAWIPTQWGYLRDTARDYARRAVREKVYALIYAAEMFAAAAAYDGTNEILRVDWNFVDRCAESAGAATTWRRWGGAS